MRKKMRPLPPLPLLNDLFFMRGTTMYRRSNKKRAGGINGAGYLEVSVLGYGRFNVSRIAFYQHNGVDPYPYVVDHRNHRRLDHSKENLFAVTTAVNNKNRKLARRGSDAALGVRRRGKRWVSYGYEGNKYIHIGSHSSYHEATSAASAWRNDRGYTNTHGY